MPLTRFLSNPAAAFALIVAAAIATRIVAWWDPVMHGDDQLYLLVGSRMWHGEWPYLDLWDRKPVGLFALYAVIAKLGGDSMVAVKLVATAFVVGTGWIVRAIATRFANARSATLAGLSYVVILPLFGGQTGQSPVFYNLFIAGAALLLFRALDAADWRSVRGSAFIAMALCGLSLTIKPVSLFEGVYFGLAFLWLLQRSSAWPSAVFASAVAMIAIALVPTALTFLPYLLRGREAVQTFTYANFGSVFGRTSWGWTSSLAGATLLLLFGVVLAAYALFGLADLKREPALVLPLRLLLGWLGAAFIAYLAIPNFFDHYALPLMAPLSVAAARFYQRPRGPLFFGAFAIFCMVQQPYWNWRSHEISRQTYERVAAEVGRARHGGCLYVAKGPSLLYLTTGGCRVTRFIFPPHLMWIIEQGAIGTDNIGELRRTLAARPAVIVTRAGLRNDTAPAADALLQEALARGYRRTYRTSPPRSAAAWPIEVYQRRDLPPPR